MFFVMFATALGMIMLLGALPAMFSGYFLASKPEAKRIAEYSQEDMREVEEFLGE